MNKQITHCLLCERELRQSFGWKQLLQKHCRKQFARAVNNFQPIEQQQEQDLVRFIIIMKR